MRPLQLDGGSCIDMYAQDWQIPSPLDREAEGDQRRNGKGPERERETDRQSARERDRGPILGNRILKQQTGRRGGPSCNCLMCQLDVRGLSKSVQL